MPEKAALPLRLEEEPLSHGRAERMRPLGWLIIGTIAGGGCGTR